MPEVKKAELFVFLAGKVLMLGHSEIINLPGSESVLGFTVPKIKTVSDAMLIDTTVMMLHISKNTSEARISLRKTPAILCWTSLISILNLEESRQLGTPKQKLG